jgi:hypothetical protein
MIEKRDDFIKEIEKLCSSVKEKGQCDIDTDRFKESFFRQSSHSPDNLESIEFIEFGSTKNEYQPNVETFGLKIKGKNVLLSDIIYLMENEEISNLIAKEFPELTFQEIEAAQRVMTITMLGLQCRKIESDKE